MLSLQICAISCGTELGSRSRGKSGPAMPGTTVLQPEDMKLPDIANTAEQRAPTQQVAVKAKIEDNAQLARTARLLSLTLAAVRHCAL